MRTVKAKFECTGIDDQPEYQGKHVELVPVVTGSEENKSFSKFTPSGILNLMISYETPASDFFTIGGEYYLDIRKADAETGGGEEIEKSDEVNWGVLRAISTLSGGIDTLVRAGKKEELDILTKKLVDLAESL